MYFASKGTYPIYDRFVGKVYVTDDSTYLKYFTAPYVESFSGNKNGGKIKRVRELWKNGEPDANEFISFLENPCTIHPYREYLKKELIPIPLTNEKDYYVFMTDYKLKEDPFMKAIFSSKVYPNDPCPCGSGKKYKKCCGRLF